MTATAETCRATRSQDRVSRMGYDSLTKKTKLKSTEGVIVDASEASKTLCRFTRIQTSSRVPRICARGVVTPPRVDLGQI